MGRVEGFLEARRGLTTAASLWTVAAIGLAVGGGQYVLAIGSTVVVFAVLAVIKPLERHWWSRAKGRLLIVVADPAQVSLSLLETQLLADDIPIREALIERASDRGEAEFRISIQRPPAEALEVTLKRVRALQGVRSVRVGR